MTEPTKTPAAGLHTARADIATELAPRYAKQLTAHLGHKADVQIESEGTRITLTGGSCLLIVSDKNLELRAGAETAEGLERVQRVIGSHLERFGQRDGITVLWSNQA